MPENEDRSSRDDALKINIKIPKEPEIISTDYDDDPIAEEFVFRGNMTSKRSGLFSSFMNIVFPQAEAATLPINDNGLDDRLKTDLGTQRVMQLKGRGGEFPMDGNDEYGRLNDAQRAIVDMDMDDF